ncbi:class I SAM-dependent methyltransferase [Oceanicaulis alexandrii]|uniref:class I SAM-dependent methyltransferase n=1 Tax=Oceanicaulis alexandrii TaxID=153233 RepID=UPI0035D08065
MTSQTFWDRHAPGYAKKPIADVTAYEEKLRCVTAILKPSDHVLEVGCGTGGTARRIAPFVAHVTATDFSAEMIRIASARLEAEAGPAPEFLQAEAFQDITEQPYDVICAFSLLHLLEDIPSVVNKAFRQTRPGGRFISKTVCLKDAPQWMRAMVRVLMAVRIAPKVTILSRAELTRHLIEAGFEIDQTQYFGKNRLSPFIVARRPAN